VHEYVLICPTDEGQAMLESVPWMLEHLLKTDSKDEYQALLYLCWAHSLENLNTHIKKAFEKRYDYRCEGSLHTLYNELTKEIAIIIINRCQIILKCDKIPNVVIETIKNYYPTLRIFDRNQDFKEVKL